ncbi:hypothetical protein APED_01775 [Acanthopleuribacter pedis]
MRVRFFGFKFGDPREFVERPALWWGSPKEEVFLNESDSYISTVIKKDGQRLTLEAVVQRVFFLEEFYEKFSSFEGIAVYVFPDAKDLIDQSLEDYRVFQACLENKEGVQGVIHLYNSWHNPKDGFVLGKSAVEKKVGVKPLIETCLGQRDDVDQKGSFLKLIEYIKNEYKGRV